MYSVTKGSIWEIWDEMDFTSVKDAIQQADRWTEEYTDQEVIIYDDDGQVIFGGGFYNDYK